MRGLLALVLRSTHSKHERVGLLRFCFLLVDSAVVGEAKSLFPSASASASASASRNVPGVPVESSASLSSRLRRRAGASGAGTASPAPAAMTVWAKRDNGRESIGIGIRGVWISRTEPDRRPRNGGAERPGIWTASTGPVVRK